MAGEAHVDRTKNGATAGLVTSFAPARGGSVLDDDPMSKVLGLDERTSGLGAWLGFTSGSTLLLVGMMALASMLTWVHAQRAHAEAATEEIEILREEPPPPPPPAPTAEPEAKPEPAPPQPVRAREPVAPPPAPAQAAKVLTQEPDPNEPVDLTGNTIVQGNSDTYAGGFTTANGSSASAVRAMPAATGVAGGTARDTGKPPAGPDLSRRANVASGDTQWNCPFPPESDETQLDEARVMLQVDVRPDGTPSAVRVLSEQPPGSGFGREARRCAMNKRYTTELDRDGHPIAGTTPILPIHFSR
ncbi:MAG: energy transducer TonB [Myxococcales bacterium]|nr:energy transducer TonB [Myxococcales bacterium]